MPNFVKVKIYDSEKHVFVQKHNVSGIWNTDDRDRVIISMNNKHDTISARNPYKTIEEFVNLFEPDQRDI